MRNHRTPNARHTLALALPFVAVLASACGPTQEPPQNAEDIVRAMDPPERLVDTRTGDDLSLDQLRARLLTARVIYVGEQHDSARSHAMEYLIMRLLVSRDSAIAVGMEMFQQPFQNVLDEWVDGRLDEEALRRDSEWDTRWGHDFSMYRPLLELARSRGIKLYALNAPKELAHAIAQHGITGVDAEQQASLPEMDMGNQAHHDMVVAAMAEHEGVDAAALERMYQAQVLWDETMAANVAAIINGPNPPSHLLVLAGDMHVRRGLGIPARAARRGVTSSLTVLSMDDEDEFDAALEAPADEKPADLIWLVVVHDD